MIAGILALLLIPLHRIIIPLWPGPIEEVLVPDSAENTARLQAARRSASRGPHPPGTVYTQPHNAVRIERVDESPVFGYVLGYREPGDGQLLDQPVTSDWNWLESVDLPRNMKLVVEDAGGRRYELGAENVVRLVRPNRMDVSDKVRLTWVRLAALWNQRRGADREPGTPEVQAG